MALYPVYCLTWHMVYCLTLHMVYCPTWHMVYCLHMVYCPALHMVYCLALHMAYCLAAYDKQLMLSCRYPLNVTALSLVHIWLSGRNQAVASVVLSQLTKVSLGENYTKATAVSST
jgi:hypothetical protein